MYILSINVINGINIITDNTNGKGKYFNMFHTLNHNNCLSFLELVDYTTLRDFFLF